MLGLIDSSQIKVSAYQFHVTISRAQVKGSSRSSISETNEDRSIRGGQVVISLPLIFVLQTSIEAFLVNLWFLRTFAPIATAHL